MLSTTATATATAFAATRRSVTTCCSSSSGEQEEAPLSVNGDTFARRHIGPSDADVSTMLARVSEASGRTLRTLDELTAFTVPENIRTRTPLRVGPEVGEAEALAELRAVAAKNRVLKSLIGMGYSSCVVPQVIVRNVLLNPSFYTPYTPYQAEVAQGRLEAMLAFQTMVADLTGLPIATCSLLDEGTAAAEAMRMCVNNASAAAASGNGTAKLRVVISAGLHPQVADVIRTRAAPLGVEIVTAPADAVAKGFDPKDIQGFCGFIGAYPDTYGTVEDLSGLAQRVKKAGGLMVVSADPLALALLKEPAAFGADVVVGSSGRIGCPLGYGGAHAAFLATTDNLKRTMPGRIIGVSRDAAGARAYRMALGTREQHIRRERATSNICTASALMCQMSAFYAMYHGPEGIRTIASKINHRTRTLAASIRSCEDLQVRPGTFFDTVVVHCRSPRIAAGIHERARARGMNLREIAPDMIGVSLDETTTDADVVALVDIFTKGKGSVVVAPEQNAEIAAAGLERKTKFMTHPLFNTLHSETDMMRYLHNTCEKDVGLNRHMTPLGSCTMKLNSAAVMAPVVWPEFSDIHPFAPLDQARGYAEMISGVEKGLCDLTGFPACSVQPNSGASGEYAGLLAIRGALHARGEKQRVVCLLPKSAHGTNPASASMVGFETVGVKCDAKGNIDMNDLRAKAERAGTRLACVMMTYPSTHGVYEDTFREAARIVHGLGGLVYMDGANFNAAMGVFKPAEIGADVCHLNLHKTFAMPHGGGGPGVGPICCTRELAPYLPGHGVVRGVGGRGGAVSSAPWGSAGILPITWMFLRMLGSKGLKRSTQVAVLNANYMAARLRKHYDLVYSGPGGAVAHEFMIDIRPLEHRTGITATDVAKRLIDFGFHAPTLSFPVAGTLMIEPTESEPLGEIDRFCDALIAIRGEIAAVERGELDRHDNPLKNAPHTALECTSDKWEHKYSRQLAAYPLPVVKKDKYFPPIKRVNDTYGDLHLQPVLPAHYDD